MAMPTIPSRIRRFFTSLSLSSFAANAVTNAYIKFFNASVILVDQFLPEISTDLVHLCVFVENSKLQKYIESTIEYFPLQIHEAENRATLEL